MSFNITVENLTNFHLVSLKTSQLIAVFATHNLKRCKPINTLHMPVT